nr:proline-rich protein 36-like [Aegilops tauschii subsp. strangulata]
MPSPAVATTTSQECFLTGSPPHRVSSPSSASTTAARPVRPSASASPLLLPVQYVTAPRLRPARARRPHPLPLGHALARGIHPAPRPDRPLLAGQRVSAAVAALAARPRAPWPCARVDQAPALHPRARCTPPSAPPLLLAPPLAAAARLPRRPLLAPRGRRSPPHRASLPLRVPTAVASPPPPAFARRPAFAAAGQRPRPPSLCAPAPASPLACCRCSTPAPNAPRARARSAPAQPVRPHPLRPWANDTRAHA